MAEERFVEEEKPSWREYRLDNKDIWDWIAWEAFTHESVLRNKDDSVLGVIRYEPCAGSLEGAWSTLPGFARGWVMNIEEQHTSRGTAAYLVLTWNPFKNMKGEVTNTLERGKTVAIDGMEAYLYEKLVSFRDAFPDAAHAHILRYQEIVDYLVFTLAHGRYQVTMPEIPVDLDYALSRDFDADFSANRITFGEETFLVLTLPDFIGSRSATLRRLIDAFVKNDIPCRHVQRLLFFSPDEVKKERGKRSRMRLWCPSRHYIKELIEEPMNGNFYGYYNNTFVALVPTAAYEKCEAYLRKLFEEAEEFYLLENFNAKQRWWGTIPAHFRAGIVPPVYGFLRLEDLLYLSEAAKGRERELLLSIEEEEQKEG